KALVLDPPSDQDRPAALHRIVVDPGLVAHRSEGRRDLGFEIAAELREALRHLALGVDRDPAREIREEGAVVVMSRRARSHRLSWSRSHLLLLLACRSSVL